MSEPIVIVVAPSEAGTRLDRFLAERAGAEGEVQATALGGLSRARVQKLVVGGRVTVNGRPVARVSLRLSCGDNICVIVPEPEPLGLSPEPIALDVLYEDEHLIAVNKPAGMLTHPGAGHAHGTLVNALLSHCGDLSGIGGVLRPGIVHRLDRGTSGVIVAAKHDRAHERLARQFVLRQVAKCYIAFVYGSLRPPEQTIDTSYGRHPVQRKRFTGRLKQGKRAITHVHTQLSGGGLSLLSVDIETGRTHQIRVHLYELGHPIVGDPLYSRRHRVAALHPALQPLVYALSSQALHAATLSIKHPISGAALTFQAPLRADLAALDATLRAIVAPGEVSEPMDPGSAPTIVALGSIKKKRFPSENFR